MRLKLSAFKATIETDVGSYGTYVQFTDGLNVLRAENTSGKTGLMTGILFALGLEILTGKKGVKALKPVYSRFGDFDDQHFNVIESFVELEIENMHQKAITVRRHIKSEYNPNLIDVYWGRSLTSGYSKNERKESFYVGLEGSAQRERGFHKFLAQFLELDLPLVGRFTGGDVPLYIECIMPLFFVEQVRGWSGIQATLPTSYGIRNVAKIAIEYTLQLDVMMNEKKRLEIKEEHAVLRQKWKNLDHEFQRISLDANAHLREMPHKPTAVISVEPWLAFEVQDSFISLDKHLVQLRLELEKLKKEERKPKDDSLVKNLEGRLSGLEEEYLVMSVKFSDLNSEIGLKKKEIQNLKSRAEFIDQDIQRNKDVKRLQNFGMKKRLSTAYGKCPTCSQDVEDNLLPLSSKVMTLEENIKFLEAEKDTIELLNESARRSIEILKSDNSRLALLLSEKRKQIRDLKSDLFENRSLSYFDVRKQVKLEEEILRIEKIGDLFEVRKESLKELAKEFLNLHKRESELPDQYFSDQDNEKFFTFSRSIARLAKKFGFRSTGIGDMSISKTNYRPVFDNFEVLFSASASDNIRLIWAFTLSLLETSNLHGGNHFGLIFFDEPEQQKMKDASSDALYREISDRFSENSQVIIATSGDKSRIRDWLVNIDANLVELGERVISPQP